MSRAQELPEDPLRNSLEDTKRRLERQKKEAVDREALFKQFIALDNITCNEKYIALIAPKIVKLQNQPTPPESLEEPQQAQPLLSYESSTSPEDNVLLDILIQDKTLGDLLTQLTSVIEQQIINYTQQCSEVDQEFQQDTTEHTQRKDYRQAVKDDIKFSQPDFSLATSATPTPTPYAQKKAMLKNKIELLKVALEQLKKKQTERTDLPYNFLDDFIEYRQKTKTPTSLDSQTSVAKVNAASRKRECPSPDIDTRTLSRNSAVTLMRQTTYDSAEGAAAAAPARTVSCPTTSSKT